MCCIHNTRFNDSVLMVIRSSNIRVCVPVSDGAPRSVAVKSTRFLELPQSDSGTLAAFGTWLTAWMGASANGANVSFPFG